MNFLFTFLHMRNLLSFGCLKQEHKLPIKMKLSYLNKTIGTSAIPEAIIAQTHTDS